MSKQILYKIFRYTICLIENFRKMILSSIINQTEYSNWGANKLTLIDQYYEKFYSSEEREILFKKIKDKTQKDNEFFIKQMDNPFRNLGLNSLDTLEEYKISQLEKNGVEIYLSDVYLDTVKKFYKDFYSESIEIFMDLKTIVSFDFNLFLV